MIVSTGVDIVKTARFKDMTQRFLTRVYTPTERAYLLPRCHISAAGLFAAKEAVAKALGTGFSGFWPDAIEITHDAKGKPEVTLHGKAAELLNELGGGVPMDVSLSISHTDTDALAFAVVYALR